MIFAGGFRYLFKAFGGGGVSVCVPGHDYY